MISKRIIFFALMIVVLLVVSCGREGDQNPNAEPVIYITSYGGVDSLTAIGDSIVFQQTIFWEAYDSDGWVEAFAYRILNEDGQAISTPGNDYIIGDYDENGVTDEDEGWVLHYKAGADESIPLGEPEANKTVWTDAVFAEINFPANGEQLINNDGSPQIDPITGNFVYAPVTSIFEIMCMDDRGGVSDIFRRYYKSTSKTPSILAVESTQGPIDGRRIGTGVILKFRISDTDPLIGDEPNYFEFKLQIKNNDGSVVSEADGGYDDVWHSTRFQEEVTEFLLIPEAAAGPEDPGPFIINNTLDPSNEEAFLDSTYITVKAYDLAGIQSQEMTIKFAVKEGFYPGSLIYSGFDPNGDGKPSYTYNDIFALGEYHYSSRKAEFLSTIDVPEEVTIDGYRYGLPLWIDKDSVFTAINSPDLKIYMHWGFQGEYGEIGQSTTTVTNSPYNQRVGLVLDEDTQEIYFSELKFFDLQLDGEPYHYAPLAGVVDTYYDDLGGWTRIPVGAEIDQNTILFEMETGIHSFKVRAVDLSNIGDPTPAEMRFNIVEPIQNADKAHKILIIDDDDDANIFAPDDILDAFYLEALSDYTGTIDTYDLWDSSVSGQEVKTYNSLLHFDLDAICPIDLQDYELVIYHSDKPTGGTNFYKNNDCLKIFYELGGDLIACLANNAYSAYNGCNNNSYYLLEDNFGIPMKIYTEDPDMVIQISQSNFTNPFMIGSSPVSPYTTQLDLELDPEKVWNSLVNTAQGLGPCSYFAEDLFEEDPENPFIIPPVPICRYICKAIDAPVYPPTQEQFDLYNDQVVGIKHITETNSNYMFGFGLPYMQVEEVKVMFNEILSELGL